MPNYNSAYTGAEIDAAVSAVQTAIAADGIVNTDGLDTILGNYLTSSNAANIYQPIIAEGTTGQFYRGDKTWSNTLTGSLTVQDRLYAHNWIQFDDASGLYMPNSGSGTHFYPANSDTTYGSFQIDGLKNSYYGITMGPSNTYMTCMSNDPHQGLYNTSKGCWIVYYNRTNNNMGLMTSSLTSGYSITLGGATQCTTINSNTVVGGSWISGTHNGTYNVRTATTAGSNAFFQAWFSGKTPSGAWGIGPLSGYNDLYFSFGTDANYNAGTNTTANARITPAGAFTNSSKRELKENIKLFEFSGLDIINTTNICSFNMKADPTKAYRVGFIADDTNPIISGRDQDVMDLQNCIGVLMKAVQELSNKIDKLENK